MRCRQALTARRQPAHEHRPSELNSVVPMQFLTCCWRRIYLSYASRFWSRRPNGTSISVIRLPKLKAISIKSTSPFGRQGVRNPAPGDAVLVPGEALVTLLRRHNRRGSHSKGVVDNDGQGSSSARRLILPLAQRARQSGGEQRGFDSKKQSSCSIYVAQRHKSRF